MNKSQCTFILTSILLWGGKCWEFRNISTCFLFCLNYFGYAGYYGTIIPNLYSDIQLLPGLALTEVCNFPRSLPVVALKLTLSAFFPSVPFRFLIIILTLLLTLHNTKLWHDIVTFLFLKFGHLVHTTLLNVWHIIDRSVTSNPLKPYISKVWHKKRLLHDGIMVTVRSCHFLQQAV
jgi:hypothetical protein